MREGTRYAPHPVIAYGQAVVQNLCATTGRDLEAWRSLIHASGVVDTDRVRWLHEACGLTRMTAANLVEFLDGAGDVDAYDPDACVEAMFAGPRAWMEPIHARLLNIVLGFGPDVAVAPGKTLIPYYRGQKFGQLVPETNRRLRLYVLLRGEPAAAPWAEADPKKDKFTHYRDLGTPEDADAEVTDALRRAYKALEGTRHPWRSRA